MNDKEEKKIVEYYYKTGTNLYEIGKRFNHCHTIISQVLTDHFKKEQIIINKGKHLYTYVNKKQ